MEMIGKPICPFVVVVYRYGHSNLSRCCSSLEKLCVCLVRTHTENHEGVATSSCHSLSWFAVTQYPSYRLTFCLSSDWRILRWRFSAIRKCQVTIPRVIRELLKLRSRDRLVYVGVNGHISVKKSKLEVEAWAQRTAVRWPLLPALQSLSHI